MATNPGSSAGDLVGCMRRMSIGSDNSSYSLLSYAPSLQSVNSIESAPGGVQVLPTTPKDKKQTKATKTSKSKDNLTTKATNPPKHLTPPPTPTSPASSPFWHQFPGFIPDPTTTFKQEFDRLAQHLSNTHAWGQQSKRNLHVEALSAEISFQFAAETDKLHRWQDLCRDVGIVEVPASITQCKKSLKPILVNIFNLIDHRRNPETVKVLKFKSYKEFCKYTKNGRTVPKQCAKKEGFVKVLLKAL